MSVEIEVKYLLTDAQEAALRSHPRIEALANEQGKTRRLISTYYDSSELHLKAHKIALRVRAKDTGYVQTVKGAATSTDGLSKRLEVEWPIEGPGLDGTKLMESQFADQIADAGGVEALKPVFVTDFQRLIRDLTFPDGTKVELAIDNGAVISGDARETIQELEMELKEGNQDTMVQFCQELKEELSLEPGNQSKAKRGYALFKG